MIYITGNRNGYDEEQCGNTLTVGELIDVLSQFNSNENVYLMNDGGYTYGAINEEDISDNKKDLDYRY